MRKSPSGCLLALINEGCDVLREGVAYRASDIDVVYLYGYGFPSFIVEARCSGSRTRWA